MTACQLCTAPDAAPVTLVPSGAAALCPTCAAAMTEAATDGPHWTCLHDAVWSDDAIVQGMAWRVLTQLGATGAVWANDLMDICDPSPDVRAWAEAGTGSDALNAVIHRDSNGAVLAQGDTVTLIKDLPVKGAGFTAKRGTAVRGISLVPDNAGQIEGRVEGQRIVILTEFVKKS